MPVNPARRFVLWPGRRGDLECGFKNGGIHLIKRRGRAGNILGPTGAAGSGLADVSAKGGGATEREQRESESGGKAGSVKARYQSKGCRRDQTLAARILCPAMLG